MSGSKNESPGKPGSAAMAGDQGENNMEGLDSGFVLIHPPSPRASMKALKLFVRDHQDVRNRRVRRAVNEVLAEIARRETDPTEAQKVERRHAGGRAAALAKAPDVRSAEDARTIATGMIAEHGGRAVRVAARERDDLFHTYGEEEASKAWQKVIDAILSMQPQRERIQALREDTPPAVEAGMLLISYDNDPARAHQHATNKRDEAKIKGDDRNAEKWKQVMLRIDQVRIRGRTPQGTVN